MRDLAKINQIRAAQNLAPLDKLPDLGATAPGKPNEPAGGGEGGDLPGDPGGSQQPDPPAPLEVDDARLLEILQKKGIPVNSLEDLKVKEDPAKVAEQREASKLSYALTKGLFSTRDHESFIREKGNPRDLVFAQFYEETKKEDAELSDAEIQAEFEDKYGISAEPGTRRHKRGVLEIGLLADKILREKYGKIYSAEDIYARHESVETASLQRTRTVLAKAPTYKADVEAVFAELKTIKIQADDKESYEVPIPPQALDAVKALFLDSEYCAEKIVKGYTKDELKEIAYSTIARQNLNTLSLEFAKQYHLKRQAGTKGIPAGERGMRRAGRVLTEDQKKVLADAGIREEDLPAEN